MAIQTIEGMYEDFLSSNSLINGNEHQVEELSVEEEANKDRFINLLNQLEVQQEGPLNMFNCELLKATYRKKDYYHVVFGLDSIDDQIYDAVYQGGEPIYLHPKNNDLLDHLKTNYDYPVNILTNNQSSYLLSVSNTATKQIEEFEVIVKALQKENGINFIQSMETRLNKCLELDNPVERLEGLRDIQSTVEKTLQKFDKQDELLQSIHPILQKVENEKSYRMEIENDMQKLFKRYGDTKLFQKEQFNLLPLHDLASKIGSLEMQNIRKEGLEGELFKSPEQAIVFSRFDVNKPFSETLNEQQDYQGASNYFETLLSEQISEPVEIVQHYLSIRDSIEDYSTGPYNNINVFKLADYAKDALQSAVKTIENEFSKHNPIYPSLDIEVKNRIDFGEWYEANDIIKETGNLARPLRAVAALNGEPISVISFTKAILTDKEEQAYWKNHMNQMTQFVTGRTVEKKMVDNIETFDFKEVKNALNKLIDAEKFNRPNTTPVFETEIMSYIEREEHNYEHQIETKSLSEVER